MEIQPKLLRLLQEREYERLGENVTRMANLRIIAATNRDLKKRVAEGLFREDLYFRLNVIAVEMPPLRSLDEDLVRFAGHYEKFFAEQCARDLAGLSPEAVACIRAYSWPGNLRELRNAIERGSDSGPARQAFTGGFSGRAARSKYSAGFRRGKLTASRLFDFPGKS